MSDINSSDWSETDASNNSAPPNGWPEGMNPAAVNDAARAMMGAIKRWHDQVCATVTSGGSANVQTLTYSVAPAALVSGDIFSFIAGYTNTGATTLNVNSLGAKAVQWNGAALSGGEIVSGGLITVAYDGTQFQLLASSRGMYKWVIQKFTSSGTYTPTSGMVMGTCEAIGGGGGGAGENGASSGVLISGGGGGGEYSRKLFTAADIGASKPATIGAGGTAGDGSPSAGSAGGDTSLGTLCIAKGGSGGAIGYSGSGGAGGTGGTGDVTIPGNQGGTGVNATITTVLFGGGAGGAGPLGGSTRATTPFNGATVGASAAANTGAGGAGAGSENSSNGAGGGAGGSGLLIITELVRI